MKTSHGRAGYLRMMGLYNSAECVERATGKRRVPVVGHGTACTCFRCRTGTAGDRAAPTTVRVQELVRLLQRFDFMRGDTDLAGSRRDAPAQSLPGGSCRCMGC